MALRREQVRPRIRACDFKLYTSEAATLHDRSLGLAGYAGCIGLEFGRMTHACITSAGTATPTTLRLRLHSRSEEHTSELQSRPHLVCRLLLEKKKKHHYTVVNARSQIRSVAADVIG